MNYKKLVKRNEELEYQLKCKEHECEELKEKLKPFKDEHFKYLDTKTIAELAKKSIRLTTENRELEDALDEIEEIAGNYTGCDDVGHFIQDTRARHALEDVSQAMVDICERIDNAKEVNNVYK